MKINFQNLSKKQTLFETEKRGNKMGIQDFYFCYDKKIMKYLRYDKGINFIMTAIHEKTGNKFWLFQQSDKLTMALQEISK